MEQNTTHERTHTLTKSDRSGIQTSRKICAVTACVQIKKREKKKKLSQMFYLILLD